MTWRVASVVVGIVVVGGAGAGVAAAQPTQAPPRPVLQGPPVRSLGQADSGTAAISGVVTDAETGLPVAGALVSLSTFGRGPAARVPRMITDSKGRFVFRDLAAADDYALSATTSTHAPGGFGRTSPEAAPVRIRVVDDQWFADANIRMWRLGAISGRIVDETNGPAVGVAVQLYANRLISGRPYLVAGPVVSTDDRGVYRIANLQPGRYLVGVPSVQSTILASTPEGAPLRALGAIATGGYAGNSRLGGAVGDLAVNVTDRHRLAITNFGPPPAPIDGQPRAYQPVFYPGAIDPSAAETVDIGYGDERRGVDFQMRPVDAARLSGRVEGASVASMSLRLMPGYDGGDRFGFGGEVATTLVEPDGRFAFLNVPHGRYVIVTQPSITTFGFGSGSDRLPEPAGLMTSGISVGSVRAAPGLGFLNSRVAHGATVFARVPVEVSGREVNDVVVRLQPTTTMRGRIVFEAEARRPTSRDSILIQLDPADGDSGLGTPSSHVGHDDATFQFAVEGLMRGRYAIQPGFGTWRMVSAMWNGRDLLATGVDASTGQDVDDVVITVTDKITTVTGIARDANGQPASPAAMIAFPVNRERWTGYGWAPLHLRSEATTSAGAFRCTWLPEGEYYLVAVPASQADGWLDPKFLDAAVPHATRITIKWGQTLTQDLVLAEVKVR